MSHCKSFELFEVVDGKISFQIVVDGVIYCGELNPCEDCNKKPNQ